MLSIRDTFDDVIFVDETCVEMESSGRIFFHRRGSQIECQTTKVANPKHPYKVTIILMTGLQLEMHVSVLFHLVFFTCSSSTQKSSSPILSTRVSFLKHVYDTNGEVLSFWRFTSKPF